MGYGGLHSKNAYNFKNSQLCNASYRLHIKQPYRQSILIMINKQISISIWTKQKKKS